MRVFLTGATGFLGARTLDRLPHADAQVVALARDPARLAPRPCLRVVAGGLETIHRQEGDLLGCDVVLHRAGVVDTWGAPEVFDQVVVRGTRDLVGTATRAGVRRLVHVSSEAVHQAGRSLLDIDGSTPLPAHASSAYRAAKRRAEQVVPAPDARMVRVVIRPTFSWGAASPHSVT